VSAAGGGAALAGQSVYSSMIAGKIGAISTAAARPTDAAAQRGATVGRSPLAQ